MRGHKAILLTSLIYSCVTKNKTRLEYLRYPGKLFDTYPIYEFFLPYSPVLEGYVGDTFSWVFAPEVFSLILIYNHRSIYLRLVLGCHILLPFSKLFIGLNYTIPEHS